MSDKNENAGKNRVFCVSANKGPITTCYRQVALDDCTSGKAFTKATVEEMLTAGDVVPSEEFYYSEDRSKLVKWEQSERSIKDAEAGNVLVNDGKNFTGIVVETEGGLKVSYNTANAKGETVEVVGPITKAWRYANDEEFEAYTNKKALVVPEPETEAIEAEPVLEPLSATERKKLVKLEGEYEKADGIERAIPFEKGRILNEIRKNNLHREHGTFGEYAFARFGITREYAQNLAQISGIPDLIEAGTNVQLSINAANELIRDANSVTRALGIGKVEFDTVAPVIRNTLALMVDVAPKKQDGSVDLSPRFISEFNEVLAGHLTDGVIEIDGKQMTVKAAAEKGLLNHSMRSEVLESAAESIKRNAATITGEWKKAVERQEKAIINGGGPDPAEVKYYRGEVPTLNVECTKHGDTEILTIGTGKIQTRCGCRWHIDADSGELVAYEVNDRRVKRG